MASRNSGVAWMPPSTPGSWSEQLGEGDGYEPTCIPTVQHERGAAGRAHEIVERLALDLIQAAEDSHDELRLACLQWENMKTLQCSPI